MKLLFSALFAAAALLAGIAAEQCGWQTGGTLCPGGLCCSQWGYCGSTPPYCCGGCQSQCHCAVGGNGSVDGVVGGDVSGGGGVDGRVRGGVGGGGCADGGVGGGGGVSGGGGADGVGGGGKQCGRQAGGALCPRGLCCSKWGNCGTTSAHCFEGCQSQCSVDGSEGSGSMLEMVVET